MYPKSKKKGILLVVLVVLILVIAGLGIRFSSTLSDLFGSSSVELAEESVLAGEPVELHFKSTGDKTTIKFPDNILVANDGIFKNETTYKFTGSSETIGIFVPPGISNFTVEVKSGKFHEFFDIKVSESQSPIVSGSSYYSHYTYMARQFNNRNVGTVQMRRASEYYRDYFAQLGYESEIRSYTKNDGLRTYDVRDVVAYKWGTEYPDEWIILGGHYDIARRTIEGALDNTGGSAAVVELAEGLSQIKTSRTIVFGLWDGEEKGLWGSDSFAKEIPENINVKANLNFDMVGLNWPQPYDMVIRIGPDESPDVIDLTELYNITIDTWYKYLDYPEEGLNLAESTGGGSDHTSFQRIGVQTFFFISGADYIQYHRRTDLVADMVAYAGGVTELQQGFATVAWTAFYCTILLDGNDSINQVLIEE